MTTIAEVTTSWQPLPSVPADPEKAAFALRLNALGSLYYFTKLILQRGRLTLGLHYSIARSLESENLRFVLELPRDHFKTTLVSEALPIWWALPFSGADEAAMRELGHGDPWIRWMKRVHNPATRTLLVSESIGNAIKIGLRIDHHYQSNALFRAVFPEILPDEKCVWNSESKHQRIPAGFFAHGEGTFDFLGVGGAVQSRHYDRIIEDDIVGRDAMLSEVVMGGVIQYHQLLAGVFDGPGEEVVCGNRWSPWDVNHWIREHEKEFVIESHSALGGCCSRHPPGIPIFPEEFSIERLEQIRQRQGPFLFSHQYLNQAVMPEDCVFKPEWLRFYSPCSAPMGPPERHWLRHEVIDGKTVPDLNPNLLLRSMVVDPCHSGTSGRSRHAIVVTGVDLDSDRIYLLDVWVASKSLDELLANVYRLARLWNLQEFWLETVAAQKYLKYHLEYRNKVEERRLRVRELKTEHTKNAKRDRIDAIAPLLEAGRFWVRHDQSAFLDEYYTYPSSRTLDILDCLGYSTQTWNAVYAKNILKLVEERRQRRQGVRSVTGY